MLWQQWVNQEEVVESLSAKHFVVHKNVVNDKDLYEYPFNVKFSLRGEPKASADSKDVEELARRASLDAYRISLVQSVRTTIDEHAGAPPFLTLSGYNKAVKAAIERVSRNQKKLNTAVQM